MVENLLKAPAGPPIGRLESMKFEETSWQHYSDEAPIL